MQICLTLEHRFLRTPDGKVWTVTQCPYSFFSEYLDVFDSLRVIARVFPVEKAEGRFLEVEGPGVEVYAMPAYKGPYGYMANRRAVTAKALSAVPSGAAVILRTHGQIANVVEAVLTPRGYPYAVDVVADPFDMLGPSADRRPAARVARHYFTSRLKKQCKNAVAVAYVTESYLQQRYPPRPNSVGPDSQQHPGDCRQRSIGVSDASLGEEAFVTRARTRRHGATEIRAVFVGTLESLYKGPDILLEAIKLCKTRGLTVATRIVGSGLQMQALKERGSQLGLDGVVEFLGSVTAGVNVRKELDWADVFVLPSRAEGVPRAMLEAMARGLPCLGSDVGGIPELLSAEDVVPRDSATALAEQLINVANDPERYCRMAAKNLCRAADYRKSVLSARRRMFYESVRDLTRAYLDIAVTRRSS